MFSKIVLLILFCSVYALSQDTLQPAPTYKPAPKYPENAKKLRVEAQIFLTALISKTGTVMETELLQAAVKYPGGNAFLESKNDLVKVAASHRNTAAKLLEVSHQTAKLWKFTPARINGKAEEAMIVIPFTFKLTNNSKPAANPLFKLKK